jgi:NAD-dependent SIR2 family protein deacetylase
MKMKEAPEFLFGKEKQQYIIVYHYDGEDVDVMDLMASSPEHAIDLAHEKLNQLKAKEPSKREYYLDLLIDPETCQIIERL